MTSLDKRLGFIQGRSLLPHPRNILQSYPLTLDLVRDEYIFLSHSSFSFIELFEPELDEGLLHIPSRICSETIQSFLDLSKSSIKTITFDPVLSIDSSRSLKTTLARYFALIENLKDFFPFSLVLPLVGPACISQNLLIVDFLREITVNTPFGITLLIEANLDPHPYVDMLNSFSAPLYITYDTGNRYTPCLDYSYDLSQLLPFIRHVHLKDKRHGKNTFIGTGRVPFKSILKALEGHSTPYQGLYTFEAIRGINPRQSLLTYYQFITSLL